MSSDVNNKEIRYLIRQRKNIDQRIVALKGEYRVICDWCKSDIHPTLDEHFEGDHCYYFAGMPKRGIYMNEWDEVPNEDGRIYYKQKYRDGEEIVR